MAPVINGNDPSVASPTNLPWEDWVCDFDCSVPPERVVRVHRHSPDFEDLSTSAALRAEVLLKEKHPCFFVNPLVTILSRDPTPEFLRMVKKHQGDWIRRTRSCFPRKMRRKVSNWVSDQGGFGIRYYRYLDRCFSLTGYLSVNGQQIQPQRWSQFEADPQSPPNPISRRDPVSAKGERRPDSHGASDSSLIRRSDPVSYS